MRKQIVVGNWKMNKSYKEAKELLLHLSTFTKTRKHTCEVIVAVPYVYLEKAGELTGTDIKIAAQNVSEHEHGSYTGEISVDMLASIDVKTVIIGHSERRAMYGETDELVSKKVALAIKHGINPIICVGETLAEREAGNHFDVIAKQLEIALSQVHASDFLDVIVAYEPVWAIGTGENATPEQAQAVHHFIRQQLVNKYDQHIADHTSILYGGSVNITNAKDIFAQPDVDGGLIGGASLKVEDFSIIIQDAKP